MVSKVLAAFTILFVTQIAAAQSVCDAINTEIENNIRGAAKGIEASNLDDSAVRATAELLDANGNLALAQMNLTLLTLNKCPVRTAPINPRIYSQAAALCRLAKMSKSDPPECDETKWKSNGTKPESESPKPE